jgi:hypothetical protein
MVIPTDMQRLTETWRKTLKKLSVVAKFPESTDITPTISSRAIRGLITGLSIITLKFFFMITAI